jgi:hypothetical protein
MARLPRGIVSIIKGLSLLMSSQRTTFTISPLLYKLRLFSRLSLSLSASFFNNNEISKEREIGEVLAGIDFKFQTLLGNEFSRFTASALITSKVENKEEGGDINRFKKSKVATRRTSTLCIPVKYDTPFYISSKTPIYQTSLPSLCVSRRKGRTRVNQAEQCHRI